MVQEIKATSSMPTVSSSIKNDMVENRKLLRALLETADAGHKTDNEKNTTATKSNKNIDTEHVVDYSTLSDKIKELLDDGNLDVQFHKDKEARMMVMKFVDKETKDIIKQFPAEITIKVAKMIASLTEHGAIADATA